MGRAFLVPIAGAFVCGIVSDANAAASYVLVVLAVLAIVWRNVPRSSRIAIVVAFVLGVLDARMLGHTPDFAADRHVGRYAVDIVDVRQSDAGLESTTVRFVDGTLGIAMLPDPPEAIGTRAVLRGSRDLFDTPRNPGEPNPRELAAERGLIWRIEHARILSRLGVDERDPALWTWRARAWASQQIHDRFPEPEATILAGAMWAKRGTLATDLKAEFQDTGTVHVLVTAGLHLGVVAALTIGLLEFIGCGRVVSSIVAIAVVWSYAALSGDHLPSVRAATMLSFGLVARAAGRDPYSWNALALAAIVVAALRRLPFRVSFALSFSCVAAILTFAKPIASALEDAGVPHLAREIVAVSLATQVGTWPLTAAAFLVIAPYAPAANALVVPVVGLAMIGGFATLALASLPGSPRSPQTSTRRSSIGSSRSCVSSRRCPARTSWRHRRPHGRSSRTTRSSCTRRGPFTTVVRAARS